MPLAHSLSIYLTCELSRTKAGFCPVPTSEVLVSLEFTGTTAI